MVLLERRFFSDDRVTIDDGWNPTNTISESRACIPINFSNVFWNSYILSSQPGSKFCQITIWVFPKIGVHPNHPS